MKPDPSEAIDGEILAPEEDLPQVIVVPVELSDLKPETQKYALRISENWRRAVSSIIETGRAIKEVRDALKKDAEERDLLDDFLRIRIGISSSERSKLEKIGANAVFAIEGNSEKLPPAVATLYKLTQLPEDRLEKALVTNEISPSITLVDVTENYFVKKVRTQSNEPVLRISISGSPMLIPDEKLAELNALLAELKKYIYVRTKGVEFEDPE